MKDQRDKKVALGIVLIPEDEVLQQVVMWNRQLHDRYISLDVTGPLPHITLSMLHMPYALWGALQEDIHHLSPLLRIKAKGISTQTSSTGKSLLWLDIERSAELCDLHKKAMKLRAKYHVSGTSVEAFYGQSASVGSIAYVDQFEDYAGENYRPHITIGYGNEVWNTKPNKFDAQLALRQLGDGCVVMPEM